MSRIYVPILRTCEFLRWLVLQKAMCLGQHRTKFLAASDLPASSLNRDPSDRLNEFLATADDR